MFQTTAVRRALVRNGGCAAAAATATATATTSTATATAITATNLSTATTTRTLSTTATAFTSSLLSLRETAAAGAGAGGRKGGGSWSEKNKHWTLAQQAAFASCVSMTTFGTQWYLHQHQGGGSSATGRATAGAPTNHPPHSNDEKGESVVTILDIVPRLMTMTSSPIAFSSNKAYCDSKRAYCDSEDGSSGGVRGGGGGMDGGTIGGAGGGGFTSGIHASDDLDSASDDDKATFFGQCLKRQLYRPKLPYPAWDYDWDHRETEATSQQALSAAGQFAKSRHFGKTRHLLLIRHGQYDERYKDDRRRKLTPLGRHQAELTGQRLACFARGGLGTMKREYAGPLNFKCIHVSDMERAKETARIIASHLPHIKINEPDPMLNEALPAPMIPIRPDLRAIREIDANHSRIEAAFQKYVHRADLHDEDHPTDTTTTTTTNNNHHEQLNAIHPHPHQHVPRLPSPRSNAFTTTDHSAYSSSSGDHHHHHHHHDSHNDQHAADASVDPHSPQDPTSSHVIFPHPEHEFEILVGHGNIIRYFFCRALQLPPEAWLRISTFNCSITYLMIYPNGYVSCRMLGDVGHLGYDNTTFSGSYGYNW